MRKFILIFLSLSLSISGIYSCSSSSTTPIEIFSEQPSSLNPTLSIENGQVNVPVNQEINVIFPNPIEIASVTESTFFLVKTMAVAASGSYDPNICNPSNATQTIVSCESETNCSIDPTSPLESETTYAVCLTNSIIFADGITYPGMTVLFTTADIVPPTITSVTPADGSANTAVNVSPEVRFSEEINSLSIRSDTIYLRSDAGTVNTQTELSEDKRTVTLTPTEDLLSFTQYTIMISSGIEDTAGNTLGENIGFIFTTADIIAPSVVAFLPEGETNIARDSSIQIRFSEEMNPATIDSNVLRVSSDFGDVAGEINYNDSTRTVTFAPPSRFYGDSRVSVSLANTVTDINGIPLNRSYNWSFTTEMPDPVQIEAGAYHTIVLADDGTVWAWGSNGYGQLGDGTKVSRNTPVRIQGMGGRGYLTEITQVAAGEGHSAALKSDHTVLTWGSNFYGQLGNGTVTDSLTPVEVRSISDARQITSGRYYTVALESDGTIWSWGQNTVGQLGNGGFGNSQLPVAAAGRHAFISISAKMNHTVAQRDDGTVWAWGSNAFGQLGNDSAVNSAVPVRSGALDHVTLVAAGGQASYAVRDDGTVWSWGHNSSGQLGNTDIARTSRVPIQVMGLTNVTQMDAGLSHVIAVCEEGSIWTWGNNLYGGLGDGTIIKKGVPIGLAAPSSPIDIAAGSMHSAVILSDGSISTWGFNYDGELGDGTATYYGYTPHLISGISNIRDIQTGNYFVLVLTSDGTVYTSGNNSNGQLGDGTTTSRNEFAAVSGLSNVIAIAACNNHGMALREETVDGVPIRTVWTWGANFNGRLGDGSTTGRLIPVEVRNVAGDGFLTGIDSIACGWNHSLAITTDGELLAWGANDSGQIGNNVTGGSALLPVVVVGPGEEALLSGVISAAGSQKHSIAALADGSVYTWGSNENHRLGIEALSSPRPVQVSGLDNIIQVLASWSSSFALTGDGYIYGWGANDGGQLGQGHLTESTIPINIRGENGRGFLNGISKITGNFYSIAGLSSTGATFSWGLNTFGALGAGTIGESLTPVHGLSNVRIVNHGPRYQGYAVTNDGNLWSWGWNELSPLRDGSIPYSTTPVSVEW